MSWQRFCVGTLYGMDNIPQMIDPSESELADMQDTPTGSRPVSFPRELSIMAESRRCDDLLAVPSEEICALPTGSVAFSGGGNTKCSTRKNCFLAGGTVASHGLSTCPGDSSNQLGLIGAMIHFRRIRHLFQTLTLLYINPLGLGAKMRSGPLPMTVLLHV